MKKSILVLLALFSVVLLAMGRYVGPPPDAERTVDPDLSGLGESGEPKVFYSGGVPSAGAPTSGPASNGRAGSIQCVFQSGSPTPATKWWADSVTPPPIPSLIHNVGGPAASGYSLLPHTIRFSVPSPHTPPSPITVTPADDKTTTIYVRYR